MDRQELINEYYQSLGTTNLKRVANILNSNVRGTYVLLRALKKADGDVCAGDIAKWLGVSTARIAVALNVLDQKGYVKKARGSHDARITNVTITEEGLKVLAEWEEKICSEIGLCLDKLTDEEAVELLGIIKKLAD